MPIDVEAIGRDTLSATSRELLRGARGTGFRYVRRERLDHAPRVDPRGARARGHQGRPPLRFRGRLRTDDGRIDLKAGGIAATVMLARAYALAAESGARPTLERLSDAAEAGTLSRSAAEVLAESFRFLVRLRLQEQLRSARSGEEPSNHVRVEALTELERRRLAEAFEAVRNLQDTTALRFNAGGIA